MRVRSKLRQSCNLHKPGLQCQGDPHTHVCPTDLVYVISSAPRSPYCHGPLFGYRATLAVYGAASRNLDEGIARFGVGRQEAVERVGHQVGEFPVSTSPTVFNSSPARRSLPISTSSTTGGCSASGHSLRLSLLTSRISSSFSRFSLQVASHSTFQYSSLII